jgi:hypothetical protein
MRARDVVATWEHGHGQHAVDRGLSLLHMARPSLSPMELQK